MDPQYIGRAIAQLPVRTNVHKIILKPQRISVWYSDVSSQEVEQTGWAHTQTTDYYGVATWRGDHGLESRSTNTGLDLGL